MVCWKTLQTSPRLLSSADSSLYIARPRGYWKKRRPLTPVHKSRTRLPRRIQYVASSSPEIREQLLYHECYCLIPREVSSAGPCMHTMRALTQSWSVYRTCVPQSWPPRRKGGDRSAERTPIFASFKSVFALLLTRLEAMSRMEISPFDNRQLYYMDCITCI